MGKSFLSSCNLASTVLDTVRDLIYGCCPQEVDSLAGNARPMKYPEKNTAHYVIRDYENKISRKKRSGWPDGSVG